MSSLYAKLIAVIEQKITPMAGFYFTRECAIILATNLF